jgi:hypothetical protein
LVCMLALSRSLAFPTQVRYILFSFCLPELLLKNETWRIADCHPHQRFSGCNDCHCYFTIHGEQWISAQTNFSVLFSDLLLSSPFGVVVQDFSFNFKILFVIPFHCSFLRIVTFYFTFDALRFKDEALLTPHILTEINFLSEWTYILEGCRIFSFERMSHNAALESLVWLCGLYCSTNPVTFLSVIWQKWYEFHGRVHIEVLTATLHIPQKLIWWIYHFY